MTVNRWIAEVDNQDGVSCECEVVPAADYDTLAAKLEDETKLHLENESQHMALAIGLKDKIDALRAALLPYVRECAWCHGLGLTDRDKHNCATCRPAREALRGTEPAITVWGEVASGRASDQPVEAVAVCECCGDEFHSGLAEWCPQCKKMAARLTWLLKHRATPGKRNE
jgi:Zn finger protein HypA/HybF involved in hydrogenase expression